MTRSRRRSTNATVDFELPDFEESLAPEVSESVRYRNISRFGTEALAPETWSTDDGVNSKGLYSPEPFSIQSPFHMSFTI